MQPFKIGRAKVSGGAHRMSDKGAFPSPTRRNPKGIKQIAGPSAPEKGFGPGSRPVSWASEDKIRDPEDRHLENSRVRHMSTKLVQVAVSHGFLFTRPCDRANGFLITKRGYTWAFVSKSPCSGKNKNKPWVSRRVFDQSTRGWSTVAACGRF